MGGEVFDGLLNMDYQLLFQGVESILKVFVPLSIVGF
jgi:hypothetical protein